jgi:hypothetical protein
VIAALLVLFGYYTTIDGAFRVSDLSGDVTRLAIKPGSPPLTYAESIAGIWGPLGVLINFSLLVAAGHLVQASRGASQASDGLRADAAGV